MIKKLGGNAAPQASPYGPPNQAYPPNLSPSGGHPTPPYGPLSAPPGVPAPSVPAWSPPPAVPPSGPVRALENPPPLEIPAALYGAAGDDEDNATRFLGGVDLGRLKIPKFTFVLQIFDISGQWRDWGPIHASGMNVGRAKTSADFPGLSTMAVKHMKFRYDKATLVVDDLGSLNGIYLRVTRPVPLCNGMRFRVGNQTIEFHEAEPFDAVPPVISDDGEEFCSRDLEPLAHLVLIRPDGRPGLRFPITRTDSTVIGREGPAAHIALTSDNAVSGKHAQIRREEGGFVLEDLRSRNGTFIHILGSHNVQSGDVLLAGRVLFRVVDQSGG
jgi:pSer/pThr/pTyr-binding forkhead associated (FHA) protein